MVKGPRFYTYLFSYILLVVLLLAIISGVVYAKFFHTLQAEVESSTIAKLNQFKDTVDLRMQEMNRMAVQIGGNPLLKRYAVAEGSYGSLQAIGELKQYLSTNAFLYDLVLYFKDSSQAKLYAASGTYGTDLFFQDIYGYRNWSREEFERTADRLTAPVMRPMEPMLYNRMQTEQMATYLVPLPANGETAYGVVMFLIKENALKSLASHVLTDYNGLLFILDGQGNVIFQAAKGETQAASRHLLDTIQNRPGDWTLADAEYDKRGFTVVKVPSQHGNWSYVTVLPTAQFMSKVDEARNLYAYAVGAVFIIGVLMAFLLSLKHYRPLEKLVQLVSEGEKPEAPKKGRKDELAYLSFAVGQMAKEKEGLANRLRSQAHAIRDQALLRLVQGKVKTPEEWEELKLYADLRLNKPHFAVLLLLIDDYKQFHSSNSDRMQEVLKYSLIKVFEELSSEAGTGFGMELLDGRGTVFLLNLNEGFGELEVVKELAMKAKEVYKQYFRFSVTVGIGGICQEYADIPALYVNATHAARQRFVKGNGCVIAYGEGTGRYGEWSLPVEGIDRLDKAIKQGDSREAEAAVADTFRHIVDRNVSLEAAECICFDIVNSLTRTLTELDVEIDESLGETLERLFVPRFETIEELEQMVTDICSNVCRYIAGQKESKNLVMLDRMKDYIAEHYADQTLNLDRIAGHFGLSSSYATRFFKDQTGTPLMKYIDEIRLSRTKQLLRTTDLPLKEVMAAAGYVDSTNYIRKFKKAEGVTPIQYRTIVRAEEEGEAFRAAKPPGGGRPVPAAGSEG